MKTWIIIPTYNEADNMPLLVNALLALPVRPPAPGDRLTTLHPLKESR